MQLADLLFSWVLFKPLKYIFICNLVITSIVFEIKVKCTAECTDKHLQYGKLKYTLMYFLLKLMCIKYYYYMNNSILVYIKYYII